MTDKKIRELSSNGTLDGTESTVPLVQSRQAVMLRRCYLLSGRTLLMVI